MQARARAHMCQQRPALSHRSRVRRLQRVQRAGFARYAPCGHDCPPSPWLIAPADSSTQRRNGPGALADDAKLHSQLHAPQPRVPLLLTCCSPLPLLAHHHPPPTTPYKYTGLVVPKEPRLTLSASASCARFPSDTPSPLSPPVLSSSGPVHGVHGPRPTSLDQDTLWRLN